MPIVRDVSLSAVVAGLVATIVSFSGPLVIVVQMAQSAGLDEARVASVVFSLAAAMSVGGLVLCLVTRMPVVLAWSTPGAVLLISTIGGYAFSDAVGAFVAASAAAALLGWTGWFGRLLDFIPAPVLSALLAGVLLPFVVAVAPAVVDDPIVGAAVILAFALAMRWAARYAVAAALVAGLVAVALTSGLEPVAAPTFAVTMPVLTLPTFDPAALVALGLPLLVVTMASQNAPGLAILRADGYDPDDRLLVGGASTISAAAALFGGHMVNLAAITAAIVTGRQAHPDPSRRYIAGVVYALASGVIAIFSVGVVGLFAAFPPPFVAALTGVALVGSLLGALRGAMADPAPAVAIASLATLCVTASGIVVGGIGSAFWGITAGVALWLVLKPCHPGHRRVKG